MKANKLALLAALALLASAEKSDGKVIDPPDMNIAQLHPEIELTTCQCRVPKKGV